MAKQRKHSSSKASDFFDYLGGKLSGKERNAFERRLQKDPFEAEAAEGLDTVTHAEMEEDLHTASAKIRRRIRRNHRIAWYSAAAAVASLMIVATIFFNVDDGGLNRYRTAPEFEEAVREQPSAAGVEKKRTRKDAIPEAEEVHEGLMQDEDKVHERLMQDNDLVQEEGMTQDEDRVLEQPFAAGVEKKRTRKDAIPEAEEVHEGLMRDKDPLQEEEITQENAAQPKGELRQTDPTEKVEGVLAPDAKKGVFNRQAAAEGQANEIVFMERAADANDLSKLAAPATTDVPTAQKVRQDEIPEMEEMQSLQVKALAEDISQPIEGKSRDQVTSQTLQGQVKGVGVSEPLQDQVQDVDISEPLQDQFQNVEVSEPLQDQVQDVDVSEPLQDQFQDVDVSESLQGQLSGIVYSAENMEPLPGVSLFVKGTTTGTLSGVDGSFSLNTGNESGSTLVASFIGMQTEEIPIEAGRPLEIAMVPDHVQLDEVVVVGHAVSKKTSMTSAVSRVETDPVTQNEYITASPVDGITAYREYIDSTLVYPAETGFADKEVVVLGFSVTPGGRPENFRVIRSPGNTFSREAIRVISEGPDWKPTTSNGNYIDDEVRLRIVFRTDK